MNKILISPFYNRPIHWSADKWHEYLRIRQSFEFFDLPMDAVQDILQCLHDELSWDWYEDCDGCTCVSEPGWPSKYYPPCVRHDYDWQTGNGGWTANARFHRLNHLYCMDGWRANARWLGVTIYWYAWMKWYKLARRQHGQVR